MKISCAKEIKKHEYRVGLTPENAKEYVNYGHAVYIETGAGLGSGFADEEYKKMGAQILGSAQEVWAIADMMVKVKEPLPEEYAYFKEGLILYTYLHLAADRPLTDALLKSKVCAVAYETIRDKTGALPLLRPMSEVAGRLSIQAGAKCLEKPAGGMGLLLGGIPGVKKAHVMILGAGVVGMSALKMALGLGARVSIFDNNIARLAYLDDLFGQQIQTVFSTDTAIEQAIVGADLVIGGVLIPGAAAPKLIKRAYLKTMKKGSVIVDVAVDQGGCCETTKATYHDNPTFVIDDVVHYCVANMPGAVSRTSTLGLTNATLPYGLQIANKGMEAVVQADAGFCLGINCYRGAITCKEVAEGFGLPHVALKTLF